MKLPGGANLYEAYRAGMEIGRRHYLNEPQDYPEQYDDTVMRDEGGHTYNGNGYVPSQEYSRGYAAMGALDRRDTRRGG